MNIPYEKCEQSIELPNGDRIVVYSIGSANQVMPRRELLRNVFRLKPDGSPVWRIQIPTPDEARAFLEVYLSEDGRLIAYNADSWEYHVDLNSGVARPDAFLK